MTTQEQESALDKVADRVINLHRSIERPPQRYVAQLDTAQKYLNAATHTVDNALFTLRLSREFSKAMDGKDSRGRLYRSEEDMLRAAVVFAGAGLDATLKELIRNSLTAVVGVNAHAREKFEKFASDHLGASKAFVDHRALAKILTSDKGPRGALLDAYAYALTGESLQSSAQVAGASSALGVTDAKLRKRMSEGSILDEMFRARNQIVHELDLQAGGVRRRKMTEVQKWVTEALMIGQEIINAVALELDPTAELWTPNED